VEQTFSAQSKQKSLAQQASSVMIDWRVTQDMTQFKRLNNVEQSSSSDRVSLSSEAKALQLAASQPLDEGALDLIERLEDRDREVKAHEAAHVAAGVDEHTVADQFSFFTIIVLATRDLTKMMRKFTTVMIVAFFIQQIVTAQFDVDFTSAAFAFNPTTRQFKHVHSIVEHVVDVASGFKQLIVHGFGENVSRRRRRGRQRTRGRRFTVVIVLMVLLKR
jgi:hypothetical protein